MKEEKIEVLSFEVCVRKGCCKIGRRVVLEVIKKELEFLSCVDSVQSGCCIVSGGCCRGGAGSYNQGFVL